MTKEMEWAVAKAAGMTTNDIISYIHAPNSAALGHALRMELRKRILALEAAASQELRKQFADAKGKQIAAPQDATGTVE